MRSILIMVACITVAVLVSACETPAQTAERERLHEARLASEARLAEIEKAKIEAEADVEIAGIEAKAEVDLEIERNRAREERFVQWTTALAAFTGNRDPWSSWIVPAVIGAIVGAGMILWLEGRE